MNQEQQLKLQAFLDGELPEQEAHEVLIWTQRDSAAAALLAELKNTRQAMANSELRLQVPESREFFWSKIEREIQRQDPRPVASSERSVFAWLRRWLLPAVVVGVLVVSGMIAYFHAPPAVTVVADADAPSVETTLANSDVTTYRDASEGITLVWFSYAADDSSTPNKKPTAIN